MDFRYNKMGYMLREDFYKLITACNEIGKAIYQERNHGMTDEEGNDYYPVIVMSEPEDIQEALEILNAFFDGFNASN